MTTPPPIKISDEMIAVAYNAVCDRYATISGVGTLPAVKAHSIRHDVRTALEAAAPLIAAQVLQDHGRCHPCDLKPHPNLAELTPVSGGHGAGEP